MRNFNAALLAALALCACRGGISDKPPIHIVPDMDWQPKFQPQEEGLDKTLFPVGSANFMPVEGTVPRGQLREDDAMYRGTVGGNAWVAVSPIKPTPAMLERGQGRFNIYCAPCHDRSGVGRGQVIQHGFQPPPPNLVDERLRNMADGEIFHVISNGVRNMPSYATQVPVEDRWAIVAWVRVLQRSQHASMDDVPDDSKGAVLPAGGTP